MLFLLVLSLIIVCQYLRFTSACLPVLLPCTAHHCVYKLQLWLHTVCSASVNNPGSVTALLPVPLSSPFPRLSSQKVYNKQPFQTVETFQCLSSAFGSVNCIDTEQYLLNIRVLALSLWACWHLDQSPLCFSALQVVGGLWPISRAIYGRFSFLWWPRFDYIWFWLPVCYVCLMTLSTYKKFILWLLGLKLADSLGGNK